jgi:GTPase SAR1 family protein
LYYFLLLFNALGLNVETITYKSNQFLLFDVGGKVRSLWTHYYDSLDALIFVVDGTDKERLYIVKEELAKINKDVEF